MGDRPLFIAPLKWPDGQAVKTPPFHGGIPGSIPGRVTIAKKQEALNEHPVFFFVDKLPAMPGYAKKL